MFEFQEADLDRLAAASRRRSLAARHGCDFSSNDYLGLAGSKELASAAKDALERGIPIGSGGSRLLRGNHEEHEALELDAATFFGSESALYFSTGFAANSALVATLPQREDFIVYDELIHASAHEGLRLARARHAPFGHNRPEDTETLIHNWRSLGGKGRPWIVVESLYSMDGDRAPLDDLIEIADRNEAILIVDEAHATGVFGAQGQGLAGHLEGRENVITVRTCGKALGCEGALICGASIVREFLINRGRGFIFSTAPSPLMAALVRVAILDVQGRPDRRARLQRQIFHTENMLRSLGIRPSGSQIIPIIIGDDAEAISLANRLQDAGLDVRAIRPPTVPKGTSRLRISVTLNVTAEDIDRLGSTLKAELPRKLASA